MKIVYLLTGFVFCGLCVLGMFIPFLPSTPFVLIAAFCFAKSSKHLDAWFKGTKLYKDNIEFLVKKEGLTKAAKIRIMASITIVFAIAAFFMRNTHIGLICLVVVWVGHIIGFGFFVKNKVEERECRDV